MPTFENAPGFRDRNTIVFARRLAASPERAWEAITCKPHLDRWLMVTEIDLRDGGRYSFRGGWDGWISDLKPRRHIQFNTSDRSFTRFEIDPDPDPDPDPGGEATRFRLIDRLRPDFVTPADLPSSRGVPDGVLRNQPGGPGTHWTGVAAGWHCMVDRLECLLAGKDCPDDHARLCARYDTYLTEHWRR